MRMKQVWPPYSEPEVPRVSSQIASCADVRRGVSGRMPLGNTAYDNIRPNLVSESYPKTGRVFEDEEFEAEEE